MNSHNHGLHRFPDGQSEIMNRKVEELIYSFVKFYKCIWDEYLVKFEVAYSSSVNATEMFTTFCLSYGTDPFTIPMDLVSSPHPAANDVLRSIQKPLKMLRKTSEDLGNQP